MGYGNTNRWRELSRVFGVILACVALSACVTPRRCSRCPEEQIALHLNFMAAEALERLPEFDGGARREFRHQLKVQRRKLGKPVYEEVLGREGYDVQKAVAEVMNRSHPWLFARSTCVGNAAYPAWGCR